MSVILISHDPLESNPSFSCDDSTATSSEKLCSRADRPGGADIHRASRAKGRTAPGDHRPPIPDGLGDLGRHRGAFSRPCWPSPCRWRVLVGILTGFGRMSSDSEAIALRASGISMRRILRPVLVLGVLWRGRSHWRSRSGSRRHDLQPALDAQQLCPEDTPTSNCGRGSFTKTAGIWCCS